MARNEFSADGVDVGLVFIDGSDDDTLEHHVKGDYAARALGAVYSRHGVIDGELNNLRVSVNSSRVVTIQTGMAAVEHSNGIKYIYVNTGAKTLTLPTTGSTGTVTHAIVITIDKTAVNATLTSVPGNPGEGNPATPANSLVLAYVSVPETGSPSVSTPATVLATFQATATTITGGGGGSSGTGRRATQRFTDEAHRNRVCFYNDRPPTTDATKRWFLNAAGELVEEELDQYGFARNSVANRTWGGNSAGKPILHLYDETNDNRWMIKGNRAHIVESGTESRVTTGSGAITIPDAIEAQARWSFNDFGDDRGFGFRHGGRNLIAGNPNGARGALIAEYTVVFQEASIGAIVITPNTDAILMHTANVTAPLRLIAPGDGGSILMAILSSTNIGTIHTTAQNGRVEQWSSAGVKSAAYAELPEGQVFGEQFNIALTRGAATGGADYELGPPPNYNSQATLTGDSVQVNNALNGRVPANIRALYDANSRYVFVQYGSDNNFHAYNRQSNNWTEISPFPVIDNYRGQTGAATVANPQGTTGIYTITRIDGTICYASSELIIPVINPSAQTDFWPFG